MAAHTAALGKKTLKDQWRDKDANHPWLKVIRKTDKVVLETLIHVVVGCYNDVISVVLALEVPC